MCLALDTLWREEATLQPDEPLSRERTPALWDRFPPPDPPSTILSHDGTQVWQEGRRRPLLPVSVPRRLTLRAAPPVCTPHLHPRLPPAHPLCSSSCHPISISPKVLIFSLQLM